MAQRLEAYRAGRPSLEGRVLCTNAQPGEVSTPVLMALAAARCFTGRKKIMPMEGGYHGGTLYFSHGASPVLVLRSACSQTVMNSS